MSPYDTIKLCCGPLCAECETKIETLTRELAEARSQRDGLAKATNNLCSIVNLAVHRGIGWGGPSVDDLKAYMKAALDAAKGDRDG